MERAAPLKSPGPVSGRFHEEAGRDWGNAGWRIADGTYGDSQGTSGHTIEIFCCLKIRSIARCPQVESEYQDFVSRRMPQEINCVSAYLASTLMAMRWNGATNIAHPWPNYLKLPE